MKERRRDKHPQVEYPMKILHLADGRRNIRAERAALLAKKQKAKKQFLIGNVKEEVLIKNIFKKTRYVDLTPRNQLLIDIKPFMTALNNFIAEVDPDIIHAHNIFMAKLAKKTGLPFVYDDHELWSQKIKCYNYSGLKSKVSMALQRTYYPRWEKELAKTTAILAPSTGIINFYKTKYKTKNVLLFPNMPLLQEVKKPKLKERAKDSLITVAIGVSTRSTAKHRRIEGFLDLWKQNEDIGKILIIGQNDLKSEGKIISIGRVSHYACYTEAAIGHVGIIPFLPYAKYHQFSGANKAYLYIHAGLGLITPITQTEFKPVIEAISVGYQFQTYDDLVRYLRAKKEELMTTGAKEIMNIARKRFILDNYGENLQQAYEIAINLHGK